MIHYLAQHKFHWQEFEKYLDHTQASGTLLKSKTLGPLVEVWSNWYSLFKRRIIPLAYFFRPNDSWSRGFKRRMENKESTPSFKTTHSIPQTCTPVPGSLQKRSKIGLQRQLLHDEVQDEQYVQCQQWEHKLFLTQRISFFISRGIVLCFIEAFGVSSLFKPPSTLQMRLVSGWPVCSRKCCGSF